MQSEVAGRTFSHFASQDKLDYDARVQAGINYGKLGGDLVSGDQVVVVHSDGNRPELGANLVRVVWVR